MARAPAESDRSTASDPAAEALAAGDTDRALRTLMNVYGDELYRFVCQQVGNEADAMDLVQLTFLHAYDGLSSFEGRSSLRTWLYGIAHHRCTDYHRKNRRRSRRFREYESEHEADDEPATTGVDEALDRRTLIAELEDCLQELDAHVRMAVLLRFQQSMSYRDMAAVARAKPKTLETRVRRALDQLRSCMSRKGFST